MVKQNGNDISLRLGLDDDKFMAAMRNVQKQSEKTLKDMARDGKKTTDEFKALEAETEDLSRGLKKLENAKSGLSKTSGALADRLERMGVSIGDLSGRAGPLGEMLAAIGPKGLIAAGGIGAVTLAVTALVAAANQADQIADRLTAYQSQAAASGFSVEDLRAFELQLVRNNQSLDVFSASTERLQGRIAEAANNQGELYSALKESHPELIKNLLATKSQSEAVVVLARALAEEEDRLERARVAKAALDDEGIALQKTLVEIGEKGLPGIREEARRAGVAITDDLIGPYAELKAANEELALTFDNQMNIALVNFSAQLSGVKGEITEILAVMNNFMAKKNGVFGALSNVDLVNEYSLYKQDQERILAAIADEESKKRPSEHSLNGLNRALKQNRETLAQIEKVLVERTKGPISDFIGEQYNKLANLGRIDPPGRKPEEVNKRGVSEITKLANDRAAAEREAARLLVKQGDISKALAAETDKVNRLKDAGLITDEQALEAIHLVEQSLLRQTPQYQAQLNVMKGVEAAAKGIAAATREAAEAAEDQMEAQRRVEALQRRHAEELAYISGNKGVQRTAEIARRAGDYERAGMSPDAAGDLAREEVRALESAEMRAAASNLFADGLVTAMNGGDWKSVLADGFREAANQGLYDAANSFFDLLLSNLPGLLGNVFGSGGGNIFDFGGWAGFLPKFHGGNAQGLGPSEYMAVLKAGETVSREGEGAKSSGDFYLSIDARGADREGLEMVKQEINGLKTAFYQTQKRFPKSVVSVMDQARAQRGF
jgi:hypothetical protein